GEARFSGHCVRGAELRRLAVARDSSSHEVLWPGDLCGAGGAFGGRREASGGSARSFLRRARYTTDRQGAGGVEPPEAGDRRSDLSLGSRKRSFGAIARTARRGAGGATGHGEDEARLEAGRADPFGDANPVPSGAYL